MSLLRKTHLKQTQSRPLSNRDLEDSDSFVVDDEITFGRNLRSHTFGKLVENDELSDYVKFRLWLARQRAMAAYREKWA